MVCLFMGSEKYGAKAQALAAPRAGGRCPPLRLRGWQLSDRSRSAVEALLVQPVKAANDRTGMTADRTVATAR